MKNSFKAHRVSKIRQDPETALPRTSLPQYLQQLGLADVAFMAKDYARLHRLAVRDVAQHGASGGALEKLQRELEHSNRICQQRADRCPKPRYDTALPISDKVAQIRDAIMAEPVVVVAGDTGSGKSTQLPKICLQAGRGVRGFIGHTQPRRIAARSIAERISEELQATLGTIVGYKVRFTDKSSADSYIKLMTDGILLAELQRDRYLSQYDTLIVDEAHERSLNIDFILGYLKWLLTKRDDLKIIITSATIDTEKFSRHFDDAPVISVQGRTYPVEIKYVDLKKDDKDDVSGAVRHTVESIVKTQDKGDILVFLSGEAEIKRCMDVINKRRLPDTELLPLYSRLSSNAQHAIFQPSAKRKIILATNIAETSLTIPGIRYVVDPGYARISRYSFRRKVQRLPIEKISQASANQRKGRCGRVSNGVCYRLYSEDDFEQRPEFTDPEIKRTNLAAVILQMEASRLGDIRTFPFIDPPDHHFINDGYKLLFELAAVDEHHKLTKTGRQLARYPVDPRLAKMLVAAQKEQSLYEVLVIVSALSIQDIRVQSPDNPEKAQLIHREFCDKQSDFLFYLNVWRKIHNLKTGALGRFCKQNHFSFMRMIEWRDVYRQLCGVLKDMDMPVQIPAQEQQASFNQIHRAILPGLISLVGIKNDDNVTYQAPRNSTFQISHRSCLHKTSSKWIMAESLIQTNRLYAYNVAKVFPKWIEQIARHLIKHHYYDIDWDEKRGGVIAYESTALYGLTIQPRRKIDYGKQDPKSSHPIFIQKALVERQLKAPLPFMRHNVALLERFENLEAKFRVRDIVISDARIFEFYQQRIPDTVCSEETLRMWLNADPAHAESLMFTTQDVTQSNLEDLDHESFPDDIEWHGHRLNLSYVFEPGREDDGITVEIPIFLLDNVQERDFDCLIPGMLKEKIIALIKSLPKSVRTSFIPATNYADRCLPYIKPGAAPLQEQLSDILQRETGKRIDPAHWHLDKIPTHLMMNYKVRGSAGQTLQSGRQLSLLKYLLNIDIAQAQTETPRSEIERDGITEWDFGELPQQVSVRINEFTLQKYPAIVDHGDSVALTLYKDVGQASAATRAGIRRLFILTHAKKMKYMRHNIPHLEKMGLLYTGLGNAADLRQALETMIVDASLYADTAAIDIRNNDYYSRCAGIAEKSLLLNMNEIAELVCVILEKRRDVSKKLDQLSAKSGLIDADLSRQLQGLFVQGFLLDTPYKWLQRYPAYLDAIATRINNYARSPAADEDKQQQLQPYLEKFHALCEQIEIPASNSQLQRLRWMLEEFRISLFAQGIRTVEPVSKQRLDKQLQICDKSLNP